MTPRINEDSDLSWLSEKLLAQVQAKNSQYKLDGTGPVSALTHPALIKTAHYFSQGSGDLAYISSIEEYNLLAFNNMTEARLQYPDVKIYGGYPYQIWQFLAEKPDEAVINFEAIGSVYLSKTTSFAPVLIPELHHYTVPLWLTYALSPELWGPSGKWTRFHEQLHTLFTNSGLLLDQDFPGFYPLKKETHWLGKHGFLGLSTSDRFTLILPWDFPLSGLVKLTKALARGP